MRGVGNVLDTDPEVWRKVLSVNLEGTFNMCQAFARAVRQAQTQAAIVNLSSAAGIRGVPNRLPYAASKYGVVGITQTMALELGPLGVRVNAVVPEVAVRTAQRWVEEYRASGEVTPRKMGNPSPPKLAAHRASTPALSMRGQRHLIDGKMGSAIVISEPAVMKMPALPALSRAQAGQVRT